MGLFTVEPGKPGFTRDSVLVVERRALHDGVQKIVVLSSKQPKVAGVDPYNKWIDRDTDDNLLTVEEVKAGARS